VSIKLSHQARGNLDDIRACTIETWGRNQWLQYYRGMVAAFERISTSPMSGRSRDLFGPRMRSLTYKKHLIFFAPLAAADGAPIILRIVHQSHYLPALAYYDDLDSV
jgi:toxin ParE1/3/4